jgi:hypothetical protein
MKMLVFTGSAGVSPASPLGLRQTAEYRMMNIEPQNQSQLNTSKFNILRFVCIFGTDFYRIEGFCSSTIETFTLHGIVSPLKFNRL